MCNILYLKAGQMPLEREEFDTMCYNNWHSYGLVTIVDGMMDTKRVVPESGEIDPEEIWNLLLKDRAYDRYLHVRHNTAGGTTMDNCHPFDVYYQERKGSNPRNVKFMHNGTLYDYKSKIWEGNMQKDDLDPNAPSDTKNFVDRILIPFVSAMDFGNGKGDIENYHIRMLIEKFWTASNRGILISNDQKPMLLGPWKTMKAADGSEIISANDDYFKTVSRGPEKARRDAKAEAEKKASGGTSNVVTFPVAANSEITPYHVFDFNKDKKHAAFALKSSLGGILGDYNVWDRGTAVNLGAATQPELLEIYKAGEKTTVSLMDWIFTDYHQLYEEFKELEEKHDKASKHIATITGELNELRKFALDNGLFDKKVS